MPHCQLLFHRSLGHALINLKQALVFILWTSFLYIGYQLTNRYQFFEPHYLPLTTIDQNIPFLAWTIYPYFALIAMMYAPIFYKDKSNFYKALTAITIGVLINYLIFLLYPTTFPRPPQPEGELLHDIWYRWLISIDQPTNCFPSGHITSPFIAMHGLAKEHKKFRILIYVIFSMASISILTTKQHYAVDLLGGLGTAGLGIYFSDLFLRKN
jgi:membrane-associated phospholipid phosphatase